MNISFKDTTLELVALNPLDVLKQTTIISIIMLTQTKACLCFSKNNANLFFVTIQSFHKNCKLDLRFILKIYLRDFRNKMKNIIDTKHF